MRNHELTATCIESKVPTAGGLHTSTPHSFHASLTEREGAVEITSAQGVHKIVMTSEHVFQAEMPLSGQLKIVSLDE